MGLIYIGIAQSLTAYDSAVALHLTPHSQSLYSLVIGLSNTWGLFLLMFLIGHGCVEIPRYLWYEDNLP